MTPPSRRHLGARWRALRPANRLALGALAALVVVLLVGIAGPNALRFPWFRAGPTSAPFSSPGAPLGPISTGHLVQPSGPGQTPILGADSVPFQRPSVPYVGSAPWQLQHEPSAGHALAGFASRPSYLPGQRLELAVSTSASSFDVTIWRVSGRGPDAPFERVASIGSFPGRRQGDPTVDPVTRMVSVRWVNTVGYTVPDTWPSGVYVARLASSDDVQAYVPFVIRSAAAHAILVVSAALNWQAYNDWGGSSVYLTHVGQPIPGVTRALAVSFDRPYALDGGAGQLFFLELPFLAWIDRQGLDVGYTTDYDLSVAPDAQTLPRVVVFNGHDEYWGPKLYGWLDRHVNIVGDLGLAMFGADSGYWPIQLTGEGPTGPRSFVSLKNGPVPPTMLPPGATPPPSLSPEAERSVDVEERATTSGYLAIGPDGPYLGSFADQPLLGLRYQGITSALGRYSLAPTGLDPRLLAGTNLGAGTSLGFIAGGEVDAASPSAEQSGPLGAGFDHVFAEAAAVPGREPSSRWTAQAVWRELPSGGRVFSAGTFYWGWALDPTWGPIHQVPPTFERLTLNILQFLSRS